MRLNAASLTGGVTGNEKAIVDLIAGFVLIMSQGLS